MSDKKPNPQPGTTAGTSTVPGQVTSEQQFYQQFLSELQSATSGSSSSTSGKMGSNSLINIGIDPNASKEGRTRGSAMQSMTYDQARLLPSQWMDSDPDQLKKLVNTGILNKVPGFQPGMGIGDIVSAWDDLVKTSWELNQSKSGRTNWTPWDVINTYSNPKNTFGTVKQGDWMVDAATGEKVKYVGPRSKTTTASNINLSSAEDVKALTTSVLTQALGRAPTAKEVAQYKSTINAQESANPTNSTQTQTLNDMGEVTNTSTQTSGGFDSAAQQQLVMDQAQKSQEYGKYQSGTTYWSAMMQMLGGGG